MVTTGEYTTTRPGSVRAEVATRCKHCARFAAPTEWRNLRGEGGAAVVVSGPLQKIVIFKIVIIKIPNFDTIIFYSNLLDKCICEVPVAV